MKIRKLKIENYKSGYSILELLFYITFFTVLALVVIQAIITMTRSFRESAVQGDLSESAQIMERISREIRGSDSIASISANNLRLNTKDSGGVGKTVEFILSGDSVQLWENGALTSSLNSGTIFVTDLGFTEITTVKGKAVRVILTLYSTRDSLNRPFTFYDTIVLRGDYE